MGHVRVVRFWCAVCAAVVCMSLISAASADVNNMGPSLTSLETVPVGNPGNAGELSGLGAGQYADGPDRICGAVTYEYNIGKYEVTAGQYTEFLNAVAATDTYGLYNTAMFSDSRGCQIQRSGLLGNYSYSVAGDWANRPVNYVSWGDAARFANWLHNGQRTGAQASTTTEDGAYCLNGATSDVALLAVSREADWTWAIPSEDEWYKAAYHKNDGATANYFDFPTSNDSIPSMELIDPDPGNNANYYFYQIGYTIGAPYYRTEAGEFENSISPYGTFDQGGNVWEWNETIVLEWKLEPDGPSMAVDPSRGLSGGGFEVDAGGAFAATRHFIPPASEKYSVGFRVCQVPEPGTMGLLVIAGAALARRRKA